MEWVQKTFRQFGLLGGTGVLLLVTGVGLLANEAQKNQPRDRACPKDQQCRDVSLYEELHDKLEKESRVLFGAVSILEASHEDRLKVQTLTSKYDFLESLGVDESSKTSWREFYQSLYDLMSEQASPEAQKTHLNALHDTIEAKCKLEYAGFEPEYLLHWHQALLGMIHFKLDQSNRENVGKARKHLADADQGLREHYEESQVSSIPNVLGACHAILMRTEADENRRIERAISAHKLFAESRRLGRNEPYVVYRFYVNHIEWCVDVYRTWVKLGSGARQRLEAQLQEHFSSGLLQETHLFPTPEATPSGERILGVLLGSGFKASDEAKNRMTDPKQRPVIYLNTVLLALASAHSAQTIDVLAANAELDGDKLASQLDGAWSIWTQKLGLAPAIALQRLDYNPILSEWRQLIPEVDEAYQAIALAVAHDQL